MPARPAELRPYRMAIYAVYYALTAVFAVLLIRSVVLDLYGRSPAAAPGSATVSRCVGDLERLYNELNSELWAVAGRGRNPAEAAASFNAWSRRWEHDLEDLHTRCALDGTAADPARAALADAADHLTTLRSVYVAHMERFAEQGGPEARETRASLDRARALARQTRR